MACGTEDTRAKRRREVSGHIRALLISAPRGLSVNEIQNDYLQMFGKPLPFRELEFRTALDLFKDLPDVVRPSWVNGELILRGVANAATMRVASLVARQKKPSKTKKRTSLGISRRPVPIPLVQHHIQSQVKELLTAYPSGLLAAMFCSAFKRRFGEEINFRKVGFKTIEDLLHAIPGVTVTMMANGEDRIFGPGTKYKNNDTCKAVVSKAGNQSKFNTQKRPQDNSPSNRLASLQDKLEAHTGVEEALQEEIAVLLMKRPNGIWAARLPVEYKNFYKKELNAKQCGFMSVVELMAAMPSIVHIGRPTKNGDWLLSSKRAAEKPSDKKELIIQNNTGKTKSGSVPQSLNPEQHSLIVPDGVGKGSYYNKPSLPAAGCYIELYVTHAVNPHSFWIISIKDWPKLEALSEEIRVFYNRPENNERYRMPAWLVSVGQVCCATFEDGAWYRALIIGIQSLDTIEVLYVDYGNTARVQLCNIRLLRTQFIKLPSQAMSSKLAYIKAGGGGEWSPGCCHRFYHLTKDYHPLVAFVCSVKEETLSLCMCDTSTSGVDVHINDLLVDEGYALFCPADEREDQDVLQSDILNNRTESISDSAITDSTPDVNLDYKEFVEEVCQELEQSPVQEESLIKRIQLSDRHTIHIINYEGKPCVTSAEISAMFWDSDMLRSQLRLSKRVVAKEVLSYEDHEPLFQELIKCGVKGIADEASKPRNFITLYELEGLPGMIRLFSDKTSEDLAVEVEEEVEQYKLNEEEYWLIKEQEESETSSDDQSMDISQSGLGVEELKLLLQAMSFRRKKILQSMMKGGPPAAMQTVDDLREVETQIQSLQQQLGQTEHRNRSSS